MTSFRHNLWAVQRAGCRSHRRRAHRRSTTGLTLLELLLVLALLVAVAAVAAPSFQRPLANHRIRKSGELVQIAWARARIKAMSSGQMFVFRFQQAGSQYQIAPWNREEDFLEQSLNAVQGVAGGAERVDVTDNFAAVSVGIVTETLPEDVVFAGAQQDFDARAQELIEQPVATTPLVQAWSQPIVFYPDGTTSDAQVILQNNRQRFVQVDLRGLTGTSLVSEVLVREELGL